MPPKIHVVRHAQGFHNSMRDYELRDAVLTELGKAQCRSLSSQFPYHDKVDIIFASPLRRTVQTAALSFGPTLKRKEVPFVLLPILQEVGIVGCDRGVAKDGQDLKQLLPDLFAEDQLEFDIKKIDASAVTEGWNNKEGYWAYEKEAISKRAADLRNSLFQRSEAEIVLVTHGAFAHFLTEDWDVEDPMVGTAYKNAEHREFFFTPISSASDAHIEETQESIARRSPQEPEDDEHVLEEMKTVEKMGS